jgi:hypothetical protein
MYQLFTLPSINVINEYVMRRIGDTNPPWATEAYLRVAVKMPLTAKN